MGLGTTADILNKEYCFEFDKKRQNAILVSYHKYGPSKQNFKEGMVDAIGSLKKCLEKFEKTGNTEYLIDVANYAMFRYMYPQGKGYYQGHQSRKNNSQTKLLEKFTRCALHKGYWQKHHHIAQRHCDSSHTNFITPMLSSSFRVITHC